MTEEIDNNEFIEPTEEELALSFEERKQESLDKIAKWRVSSDNSRNHERKMALLDKLEQMANDATEPPLVCVITIYTYYYGKKKRTIAPLYSDILGEDGEMSEEEKEYLENFTW